jgi:ribonuclease BN (tRNA processing enzyme)
MLIKVLGSGSCELRAARSSPAYLLQAGGVKLMLDLGQGAWRLLLEAGHQPDQIDGVIISHPHLDHMADLIPLLFALKYDPELSAAARMTLLAHPGVGQMLADLQGVFGSWLDPPAEALARLWLEPGQETSLGGVCIAAAAVEHHAHSLAWRLEAGGVSLVYLGDGGASESLARFAAGADLLICHCAGSDAAPKPGHLYPEASGRLAAAAGAGALLLSHFYRAVDPQEAAASAAANFGGAVWAAYDGLELEVTAGGVQAGKGQQLEPGKGEGKVS